MRVRDAVEIGVYLALAFGGEALVVMIQPPSGGVWMPGPAGPGGPIATVGVVHNVVFEILPYLVFFLGLGLAFRVARREHLRVVARGTEIGMYCSKCGYDLRASPERCPECGAVNSASPMVPESTPRRLMITALHFCGIAVVAIVVAAAIMVHVMIVNQPMSGGH